MESHQPDWSNWRMRPLGSGIAQIKSKRPHPGASTGLATGADETATKMIWGDIMTFRQRLELQRKRQDALYFITYKMVDSWHVNPQREQKIIVPNLMAWFEHMEKRGVAFEITSVTDIRGEELSWR